MSTPALSLTELILVITNTIDANAEEVAELDRAIGDGDHVVNLQRGLSALSAISDELSAMEWSPALIKVGMTIMSTMGGASGSLFGTLFMSMGKSLKGKELNSTNFSEAFYQGVESVKQRGKANLGEKTMLDTLIPVANSLQSDSENNVSLDLMLSNSCNIAVKGMESTKDLIATKGRASFLGELAIGHIDAGARTSQLMICAIANLLASKPPA